MSGARQQKELRRSFAIHAEFRKNLPKVQRALANVSTYMILDDHDVTDDFFLNPVWRRRVLGSRLGRAMLGNAMIAYALFQDWGNDPVAYRTGPKSQLLQHVQRLFPDGTPGPDTTAFAALSDLFGHFADGGLVPLPGGRTESAEPPLKWHFSVDGPKHRVIALDNRTRRQFASENGPPGNVSPTAMVDQIPLPPLPAGREILIVIAPLQVVGPPVLDELVAPLSYRIFDMVQASKEHSEFNSEDSGIRGMLGTDPDAIEAWTFDVETFEHLLSRLEPYGQVVLLSGDVHYSSGTQMSYWKGDATQPARFAQFTSSGLKNVMPAFITLVDSSLGLAQQLIRLGLGTERIGWDQPADDLVTFPPGKGLADLTPVMRSRLRNVPVAVPSWGWPDLNDPDHPENFDESLATRLRQASRLALARQAVGRPTTQRQAPARHPDPGPGPRRRGPARRPRDRVRRLPEGRGPAPELPEPAAQRATDPVPSQRGPPAVPATGRREAGRGPRGVHDLRRPGRPGTDTPRARTVPRPGRPPGTVEREAADATAAPGAPAAGGGGALMAGDKDLLQIIGREIVDFLQWMGEALGDAGFRGALLIDAGAIPSSTVPPVIGPPPDGIDAVNAWLDASDPSLEQTFQALGDLASTIDGLLAVLETLTDDGDVDGEELAHTLLELGATNYVRVRCPRLFVVLQAVSTIDDLTSTYGPGNNNPVAFFKSIGALAGYIWQPGKSIEHVVGGPDASPQTAEAVVDLLMRLAAVTLAAIDMKKDIEPLKDVLTGWDAPELSPDSDATPTRADIVSSRMTSLSVSHNRVVPGEATVEGFLQLTTAMLHAIEGGPGVFVAVGGNLTLQQKLGKSWTFTRQGALRRRGRRHVEAPG